MEKKSRWRGISYHSILVKRIKKHLQLEKEAWRSPSASRRTWCEGWESTQLLQEWARTDSYKGRNQQGCFTLVECSPNEILTSNSIHSVLSRRPVTQSWKQLWVKLFLRQNLNRKNVSDNWELFKHNFLNAPKGTFSHCTKEVKRS